MCQPSNLAISLHLKCYRELQLTSLVYQIRKLQSSQYSFILFSLNNLIRQAINKINLLPPKVKDLDRESNNKKTDLTLIIKSELIMMAKATSS